MSRVLDIYTQLMNGQLIHKAAEAEKYQVNERSIQRDIEDIRNYFSNSYTRMDVKYDYKKKGYCLKYSDNNMRKNQKLSDGEILALCKILLSSRAVTKEEMEEVLEKLIGLCDQSSQKIIKELIRNELFHYVELRHKTKFLENMWKIGKAIYDQSYIDIEYKKPKEKTLVKRKLKPVAILFSEYYFYVTAFIENGDIKEKLEINHETNPTIYRMDRIKKLDVLEDKFRIHYGSRFEEGEFRKKILCMYGGQSRKITFKYMGNDIDNVLDHIPTAEVIEIKNGVYEICAEVIGKGIDMWLCGQGDEVQIKGKDY